MRMKKSMFETYITRSMQTSTEQVWNVRYPIDSDDNRVWMNENLYIAHKTFPHRTLRVHSAGYTQCIHVSSRKLKNHQRTQSTCITRKIQMTTEKVWNIHYTIDWNENRGSLKPDLHDKFRWQESKFETCITRSIQLRRGQVLKLHCYTIDSGKNRSCLKPALLHDRFR